MSAYIYALVNNVNSKVYIGQTVSPSNRMSVHQCDLLRKDTVLCRAMRKHGFDNFQMIIIETVTEDLVDEKEIYWIKRFNCLAPKGYNISTGGGKPMITLEMRAAISLRRTGMKASDKTKKKMSLAHKGKTAWNAGLIKNILQYNLDGSFVKAYASSQEALFSVTGIMYTGKELETKFHNIRACINGAGGQKSAYKMIWRDAIHDQENKQSIDVPKYKCLPAHMQSTMPLVTIEELIVKAERLGLSQDDFPHHGIHNSDVKIPLSTNLQNLGNVSWCSQNQYYKDIKNDSLIIYKNHIIERLKGMTSWKAYQKSKANYEFYFKNGCV